uniref:Uncharacterized protein n=1 Tax=Cajanus cajan TaxID=3821 RepID=A0A151TYX2_CAJCA|nr:hypothetical protein KK1_004857 [Cajanus cajan]
MNPNHPMLMLKESITRFLAQHRTGATDFADFTSIFSRTLHATPDPPIPLLWFYAALQFRQHPPSSAAARDLFHLLASCSAARASSARIAALAPLLFVLHRLAPAESPNAKSEVEGLVEGVVSYCSIFCAKESCDDDADVAGLDFADLIRVWMVDDGGEGCVEGFFPLVGEGVRKGIERGCEVGVLAGVVMCEALLLKLCLAFDNGAPRAEQEKKLMASAVQTITGFRSFRFLGKNLLSLVLRFLLSI